MIRFLVSAALFLGTAAAGLLVAVIVLDGMTLTGVFSFLAVVLLFAVIQAVVTPFFKVSAKAVPVLAGVVGLPATFAALLVTTLISDGLRIRGLSTWIIATLIVWLVTLFASWLLPRVFPDKGAKDG